MAKPLYLLVFWGFLKMKKDPEKRAFFDGIKVVFGRKSK